MLASPAPLLCARPVCKVTQSVLDTPGVGFDCLGAADTITSGVTIARLFSPFAPKSKIKMK